MVEVNNKTFSTIFYACFFIFFILFAWSWSTMFMILGFISLMHAFAFKTWQIIREEY